jgi:hypothetical protein
VFVKDVMEVVDVRRCDRLLFYLILSCCELFGGGGFGGCGGGGGGDGDNDDSDNDGEYMQTCSTTALSNAIHTSSLNIIHGLQRQRGSHRRCASLPALNNRITRCTPLALVNLTTGPGILASSVHLVVLILALVNFTIGPGLLASSVIVAVLELALVNCTTGPGHIASSVLLAVLELALVNLAVRVSACALTVIVAVLPLALVNMTFGTGVLSSSVFLAVLELALVNLAARVSACARTVESAVTLSQVSVVHPRVSSMNYFVLQGAHEVQLGGGEERRGA